MTRTIEVAKANAPDLSAFDPDTTFYVYWDENEKRSKIFDGVKPNTVNINYVLDI